MPAKRSHATAVGPVPDHRPTRNQPTSAPKSHNATLFRRNWTDPSVPTIPRPQYRASISHRPPAVVSSRSGLATAGCVDDSDHFGERAKRVNRIGLQRIRHRLPLRVVGGYQPPNDWLAILILDVYLTIDAAPPAFANEARRLGLHAVPGAMD